MNPEEPDVGFSPDWASSPGETLADLLEERALSPAYIVNKLGMTEHHVTLLLAGELPLSQSIAEGLTRALGPSVDFWLAREKQYREDLARLAVSK